MDSVDVLIVGGGPAGSSCARRLRSAGLDVLVLDKANFPRVKTCAGWITPQVVDDLDLDLSDYAQGRSLQPITAFRVGRIGHRSLEVDYGRAVSFGIRRNEFDDYLLRRSQARLQLGEAVKTIRRNGGGWVVNERFHARLVVAAGGHFCPVARLLGRASAEQEPIIVAQEFEVEVDAGSWQTCRAEAGVAELYFCDDLLGYGWCVRKGNFVNVGLGRADREHFPQQMSRFFDFLKSECRIPSDMPSRFQGHAYLVYEQAARPLVDDGLVWVGDAAGLAYGQSGEGIGPAIVSAGMAADAIIAARGNFSREALDSYRCQIEARFGPRTKCIGSDLRPSRLRQKAARWLLGRRWFVDRIVLRRWFLQSQSKSYQQS